MTGTPPAGEYLIVSVRLTEPIPGGARALVLHRLEDRPEVYGVVDVEANTDDALAYVAGLEQRRHQK